MLKISIFMLLTAVSTSSFACRETPLSRATRIINTILIDMNGNYQFSAQGGISAIKQVTTSAYMISIPEEERINQYIYEVRTTPDCEVEIIKRSYNVKSDFSK